MDHIPRVANGGVAGTSAPAPKTPTIVYPDEAGPSRSTIPSSALPSSPLLPSTVSPRVPGSSSRLANLLNPGRSRSGSNASSDGGTEHDAESGRATPEHRRVSGRAPSTLVDDARYKKFVTQVDRALQSFESVNEWADFISFLSRLLKTLQSPQPAFREIPRKLIVSKRLAQCLNPALPSGVHQRTLEVYAYIFSTIGVEGLKRDLLIWSSGLFPFFSFATTSVRPHLLNLYETHCLPLGRELRPATKALILALLPGMEEETGDFFDKVLALLTRLSSAVDDDFFLHNVLLVLISAPSARLPALHYLSRRVLKPPDTLQSGLLLRGIAAALADENVLVRRNGLDMLLRIIRMDGDIYKTADSKDRDLLLRAAFDVVLQRDISLSRRVYTWLLGTGETSEERSAYFQFHGLEDISQALQADMKLDPTSPRPFRTFLALLDKHEVSAVLADRLVLPALRSIYGASTEADPNIKAELSMTANAVYEGVEPRMIWKQIYGILREHRTEDLAFVLWIFQTMVRHEEEVSRVYIPVMLEYCLVQAESLEDERNKFLNLSETLLRLIPLSLLKVSSEPQSSTCAIDYVFDGSVSVDDAAKLVQSQTVPSILQKIMSLSPQSPGDTLIMLRMVSYLVDNDVSALRSLDLTAWTMSLLTRTKTSTFDLIDPIATLILKIARSIPNFVLDGTIVEIIMLSLLRFLRTDESMHHIRAVELLWEFKLHAGPYVLEDLISQRLRSNAFTRFEQFGTFWRFTDDLMLPGDIFFTPIMTILDGLKSDDPSVKRVCETWLKVNLGPVTRILDPILCRLIGDKRPSQDTANTLYLVDSLTSLFRFGGLAMSKVVQSSHPQDSPYPLMASQISSNYPECLSEIVIKLLESPIPNGPTRSKLRLRLDNSILELIQTQTSIGGLDPAIILQYQSAILTKAEESVRLAELDLQSQMLKLLQATLVSPKKHRRSASVATIEKKYSDRDSQIITLVQSALSDSGLLPVLRHWIDFILNSALHFQDRRDLLESLLGTLTGRIRVLAKERELEAMMILEGIQRMSMLLLPKKIDRKSEDSTRQEGGSSILGYMSGVFTVEGPTQDMKTENIEWLDDAVQSLLFASMSPQVSPQTRNVLETMYNSQPTSILGSLLRVWASTSPEITDSVIFDTIDALTSNAQKVVSMIGEHLTSRLKTDHSIDQLYAGFLEAYIQRLEAPIAVQVWSTAFALVKEMASTATTPIAKAQLYPLLRCLTALGKTVATTSALEDKRLRRDLHDTYAKLLDSVMVNAPKLADVWSRHQVEEGDHIKINAFIASELIPNLRNLLVDPERIAVACSSITTGVLQPAVRQQNIDQSILNIISEMSLLGAARSWRPLIGDAFNDSRFFRMTPSDSHPWQPLISALMDTDKDRFQELLSRIQSGPSSNIFINRESEMISRSLNLRRLSFVLLAADTNHYLTQLPSIQEKLVDILRNDVVSPMVHRQHMSNFWPVILSELLKVFEGTIEHPPPDNDEGLMLVLAACKFLDLLLLMQSEDFQIHQWIFITDTTDAASPMEGYQPDGMMDRLNEILAGYSHSSVKPIDVVSWEEQIGARCPRLDGVRKLTSIYQLQPFFARASIDTFEGVYSGQEVDWERVEEGLNAELFDSV